MVVITALESVSIEHFKRWILAHAAGFQADQAARCDADHKKCIYKRYLKDVQLDSIAWKGPCTVIEALKTILRGLAVTVALTAGSLAIVTTLYILVRFAPEGASVGDVTDWYRVVRLIVSTAALGGLLADSVRWLAAMLWPANPDPRVRLSDIKR